MKKFLILFLLWSSTVNASWAKPILYTGKAKVIDGDTLVIKDTKIRLAGVDAPELKQNCFKNKKVEPCGKIIKSKVEQATENKEVICNSLGTDMYGRVLGECFVKDININEWLIREGLAVYYYNKNCKHYKQLEKQAKKEKLGLWDTKFTEPKKFRKENKK